MLKNPFTQSTLVYGMLPTNNLSDWGQVAIRTTSLNGDIEVNFSPGALSGTVGAPVETQFISVIH